MLCMFSHVLYTLCILLHFGGVVQHYILEVCIRVNTLSSASLILHCRVVFHLECISHLPTDGQGIVSSPSLLLTALQ